jgi:hypothetical protein
VITGSSAGLDVNNVHQVQMLSTSRKYTESHVLTDATPRYSFTHFPFSPSTIRLNRPNVNIASIKSGLLTHVTHIHRFEDELHRLTAVYSEVW